MPKFAMTEGTTQPQIYPCCWQELPTHHPEVIHLSNVSTAQSEYNLTVVQLL